MLSRLYGPPLTPVHDDWFFTVHLSHLYTTTGKPIALTWKLLQFVSQLTSLLFNTLARFVIGDLVLSKRTINERSILR